MAIKFKGADNKVLEVYVYAKHEEYNNKVNVYFIAAYTKDEALDIMLTKFPNLKWVEKTRADYVRQDHWDAWVDHNRAKEYNKYLKRLEKFKKSMSDYMMFIDNTSYTGKPGIFKISTIYV